MKEFKNSQKFSKLIVVYLNLYLIIIKTRVCVPIMAKFER